MRDVFGERRALIGGLGMAAAAGALAGPALGQPAAGSWSPAAEPADAWLDKPGTRHRLAFDTTTAAAAQSAMFYANTYYEANKSGYALPPEALGVVIVLRHFSTPFGFNDAMWAKYGTAIAELLKLEGEEAIRGARMNPLLSAKPQPDAKRKPGDDEPVTLATLAAKGARFGVCGVATKGMSDMIAKNTGGSVNSIEAELKANLVPGATIAAAGIVAINRAQEHGYAFVYVAE